MYLDIPPGPVGPEIYSIRLVLPTFQNSKLGQSSLAPQHELSSVIPSSPPPQIGVETCSCMSGLIAQVSPHPKVTLITDQSTSQKSVNINLHRSSLIKIGVKSISL